MNREIDNMVYRRTDPTEPIEILYNALLDFDEEEFAASPLPERKSIFPTATGGKGGRACPRDKAEGKIIKTSEMTEALPRLYRLYRPHILSRNTNKRPAPGVESGAGQVNLERKREAKCSEVRSRPFTFICIIPNFQKIANKKRGEWNL